MRNLMRGSSLPCPAAQAGAGPLARASRRRATTALLAGTVLTLWLAHLPAKASDDSDLPCNQLCRVWLAQPAMQPQSVAEPGQTIDPAPQPFPDAAPRRTVPHRPRHPRPAPVLRAAIFRPKAHPLTAIDIQLMRTSLAAPAPKPADPKAGGTAVVAPPQP